MSTQTRDIFMVAVALLASVALAYYYVLGVLDKDRLLSRGALLGFLVFCALAVILLVRSL